MSDKLYCPTFIYEICVASAVKNFLTESYSLDMLGKKYAEGISEHYKPISTEEISGPAEEILRFLSDRKNPMFEAHDLANHYVYWKLNFDGRSQRKLKGIFSDSFKGMKERKFSIEEVIKDFKAYCFSLRAGQVEQSPAGWDIKQEQEIDELGKIVNRKVDTLLG
jgi:hypothetical protein